MQERGVQLGMTFLDDTSVRAHQKAAGARRKGAPVTLGGPGSASAQAYVEAARRLKGEKADIVVSSDRAGLLSKLFTRKAA